MVLKGTMLGTPQPVASVQGILNIWSENVCPKIRFLEGGSSFRLVVLVIVSREGSISSGKTGFPVMESRVIPWDMYRFPVAPAQHDEQVTVCILVSLTNRSSVERGLEGGNDMSGWA